MNPPNYGDNHKKETKEELGPINQRIDVLQFELQFKDFVHFF